ncbi:MAG: hypothetical protein M1815_003947 [Lichina confinis]|nr:MAG: hypothetical protein M1815_003947 [Lichina confinis]
MAAEGRKMARRSSTDDRGAVTSAAPPPTCVIGEHDLSPCGAPPIVNKARRGATGPAREREDDRRRVDGDEAVDEEAKELAQHTGPVAPDRVVRDALYRAVSMRWPSGLAGDGGTVDTAPSSELRRTSRVRWCWKRASARVRECAVA